MIVYHGGVDIIKVPDVEHSYRPLDFGKGFYVTTVKSQAEKWAKRKSDIYGKRPIVNLYEFSDDVSLFEVKDFGDNVSEWIDFVCHCRDGGEDYKAYDMIIGKVADDKVFRVVDMYHQGVWDKDRALEEIKVYENYDQIAFVTQKAIEQLLVFESYYEV